MRDDKEHKIDSYFRESLENLHIIPPAEVWNNISENIPHRKGGQRMFLWIAVAASITLFAAIGGWNYFNKSSHINNKQAIEIAKNTPSSPTSNTHTSKLLKSNNREKSVSENSTSVESNIHNQIDSKSSESGKSILATEIKKHSESGIKSANTTAVPETNYNVPENQLSEVTVAQNAEINHQQQETQPDILNSEIPAVNKKDMQLSSIQLNTFNTPNLYGNVETVTAKVKVDSVVVYDNIYALEDISNEKKVNRWALGGQMAPLYSYRNISEVNAPGISKDAMNNLEKALITYSSGVKVDFEASPRLTFQSGILYMKMGQEIDNVSTFMKPVSKSATYASLDMITTGNVTERAAATNSTGTMITSNESLYQPSSVNVEKQNFGPGNLASSRAEPEVKRSIEQSFDFIEVPFIAKYKILNRKINLHVLGGVSTNVLVNTKTKVVYEHNSTVNGKTTDVQTFNYSSSVGFGMVYNLGQKLFFSVEPTFKYYINSFNTSDAIKLHPYAFGVYSGVSFKF